MNTSSLYLPINHRIQPRVSALSLDKLQKKTRYLPAFFFVNMARGPMPRFSAWRETQASSDTWTLARRVLFWEIGCDAWRRDLLS